MAAWDDTFTWSERDEDITFDGRSEYLWHGPLAEEGSAVLVSSNAPRSAPSSASEILLSAIDKVVESMERGYAAPEAA